MTDEKTDLIEKAAESVVEALGVVDQETSGDKPIAWGDLDSMVQNKVRIALADAYTAWEAVWLETVSANQDPAPAKQLGFRPIQ